MTTLVEQRFSDGMEQRIKKGEARGMEKSALRIARNLLARGLSPKVIAQDTELPVSVVLGLQEEMQGVSQKLKETGIDMTLLVQESFSEEMEQGLEVAMEKSAQKIAKFLLTQELNPADIAQATKLPLSVVLELQAEIQGLS